MINIFSDGLLAFQNHFWIIVYILLAVIWGWWVTQKILVKIFVEQFTTAEYLSLASAGWIFPVILWAGLFFCVNFLFGRTSSIIFSIAVFFIPFFWQTNIKKVSLPVITLVLFFLISLVLRFAFLQQAILPSYFDSAEHYRIIQYFLNVYQSHAPSSDLFLVNYYHAGYHFLLSSIVYLFQLNISTAMLVFGQIILAILPISFYFILKQVTQLNTVALFTCMLAGFGFHMPAHLINWGKYPALLSLVGIQFVFCLGYILAKKDLTQNQKSKLYWLIAFLILITTLIHTRAFIVFVLIIIACFITLLKTQFSIKLQYLIFGFVLLVLGIEIFYIRQSPALFPLLTGYTQRDLWALIFVLIFIPFSIKSYPNLSFFSFHFPLSFYAFSFLPYFIF